MMVPAIRATAVVILHTRVLNNSIHDAKKGEWRPSSFFEDTLVITIASQFFGNLLAVAFIVVSMRLLTVWTLREQYAAAHQQSRRAWFG